MRETDVSYQCNHPSQKEEETTAQSHQSCADQRGKILPVSTLHAMQHMHVLQSDYIRDSLHMQEGGTSVPPATPPATFAHRDSVETPRLTYLRSMSLSSKPRHGLASLHESFTATWVADTPLMFLNLTSLIFTTDGRCSCMDRFLQIEANDQLKTYNFLYLHRQEIVFFLFFWF